MITNTTYQWQQWWRYGPPYSAHNTFHTKLTPKLFFSMILFWCFDDIVRIVLLIFECKNSEALLIVKWNWPNTGVLGTWLAWDKVRAVYMFLSHLHRYHSKASPGCDCHGAVRAGFLCRTWPAGDSPLSHVCQTHHRCRRTVVGPSPWTGWSHIHRNDITCRCSAE